MSLCFFLPSSSFSSGYLRDNDEKKKRKKIVENNNCVDRIDRDDDSFCTQKRRAYLSRSSFSTDSKPPPMFSSDSFFFLFLHPMHQFQGYSKRPVYSKDNNNNISCKRERKDNLILRYTTNWISMAMSLSLS